VTVIEDVSLPDAVDPDATTPDELPYTQSVATLELFSSGGSAAVPDIQSSAAGSVDLLSGAIYNAGSAAVPNVFSTEMGSAIVQSDDEPDSMLHRRHDWHCAVCLIAIDGAPVANSDA
jgi:hypothetical protein